MNAIGAMPKGGQLTIRTRREQWPSSNFPADHLPGQFATGDELVVAEVDDTGTGIPEEYLRRVFDPFFTTKPVGVGTGLGLSVARRIIDLHGGSITIRNRSQGGVRVTLILKVNSTQLL
ncbi:MAG TPA: hypothetical protein DCE44_05360 [Verrucomicrobiales bacterium]|nr:hypothetical protein [Verrucomicrobiales bacterium]